MPRNVKKDSLKPVSTVNKNNVEKEFLHAFNTYSDALFRHAYYRLSDRERAIEIVHDTYAKAWGYIRSGHNIDLFKPFLYKVINNLIIDEYRRRKEFSLDAILAEEGMDEGLFAELHGGGIEEVMFSFDAKVAAQEIKNLPVQYRDVITLRYIDGLGPKEISEFLEETENVVSVRIHRGLKILRKQIEKKEGKSGI